MMDLPSISNTFPAALSEISPMPYPVGGQTCLLSGMVPPSLAGARARLLATLAKFMKAQLFKLGSCDSSRLKESVGKWKQHYKANLKVIMKGASVLKN